MNGKQDRPAVAMREAKLHIQYVDPGFFEPETTISIAISDHPHTFEAGGHRLNLYVARADGVIFALEGSGAHLANLKSVMIMSLTEGDLNALTRQSYSEIELNTIGKAAIELKA